VETITLDFLAAQQERLIHEVAQMRDDIRVMAAILQRMDGTLSGLVAEVRAEHARFDRLASRVRTLEDERPPPGSKSPGDG
jgi:outer membrane murein-binding lipoprotein Lpp